jgi:hypothetical protein
MWIKGMRRTVDYVTTDRAVLKAFPKRAMTSATFLDE